MHINPSHIAIAGLIGGALTFQVPRFQRNYAWTPEETGALLRDLDLCHAARTAGRQRHHFFGGIVTAHAPVSGSTRQNLELIDGQQRLASFVMLAVQLKRAMHHLASTVDQTAYDSPATFLKERAKLLQERYESYKDSINLRVVAIPRLQLSSPDQAFFEAVLRGASPQPERKSHQLLKAAFEDIGGHLRGLVDRAADDPGKARALDVVHDICEQDWTVIHMSAEARSDAYMLFQVLNDRGIRLTEGELLRAITLEALEPVATAGQMQIVEESWNEMLRGEASKIRDAFRWVYASQVGTYPGGATLLADVQRELFPVIQAGRGLTREEGHTLISAVQALQQDVAKLDLLMLGEWPYTVNGPTVQWDRDRLRLLVVHLKQLDCMPLLVAGAQLSAAQFSDIVQVLERFLFRYAMADGPRAEIANAINKHAVEIRRNPGSYDPRTLVAELRELIALHAPDEVFRDRLNDMRYPRSESKKPLKYFLMTLEHYVRWFDEGAQGRPVCRDKVRVFDFENGTIEHVYAENAAHPDVQLDPLLDTIGNLTFLSPAENEAAGAKSFSGKKPYLAKSTSTLNREIAAEDNWTAEVVKKRQERLIAIALRVFSV